VLAMQALLNRKGFGRLALRQVLTTLGFLLLTLPINQKTLLFTEQVLPLVRKMDAMGLAAANESALNLSAPALTLLYAVTRGPIYDMYSIKLLCVVCNLGLAILAAHAADRRNWGVRAEVLLTLCLTAALALPTLTTETQSDLYLRYGETYPPYMYGTEYTMEGTNFAYTLDKNPHVEQGEISLTAYAKQGTKIEMQVEAQTDGVISVPLFGYDGYRAQADGQELETGLDENKRLTVVVPAGTKGEVKLWYAGKRWWRISDAVSLLTALALIAARIQHRRKAQKA